jgi:hypothetical protein
MHLKMILCEGRGLKEILVSVVITFNFIPALKSLDFFYLQYLCCNAAKQSAGLKQQAVKLVRNCERKISL